jgi:predicted secreted protein
MRKITCRYIAFNIMLVALVIISVVLYAGCSPEPRGSEDDEPTPSYDKTIDVKVGDQFTITLGSQPSTGYEWELDFDLTTIRLDSKSFVPDSNLTGSPGTDTYTFTALAVSKTKIEMIYKREWEDEIIDEYSVLVRITQN